MRRLTRRLIALIIVAVIGASASAVPAGASGSAPAGRSGVVLPGRSIQRAIDAARAGDTIVVLPGTYRENLSITKSRITLVGWGVTLLPPAHPRPTACADPDHPDAVNGICVAGDLLAGPQGFEVKRTVRHVSVIGFTVKKFNGIGIFSVASDGTRIIGNHLIDDGAYGVYANTATNTFIALNRARNSQEAGIYVGDSPDANATVIANDSAGASFGVFVRNAEHATIVGNKLHDNCVGALVLADAPGPAGNISATGNVVEHNTKLCPPGDDGTPPLSGIGFALAGAHDVRIDGNVVADNRPSGAAGFAGGVVVVSGGPGATSPANNTVVRNIILGNAPDLFYDGSGTGNTFRANICRTSVPAGLCRR